MSPKERRSNRQELNLGKKGQVRDRQGKFNIKNLGIIV